MERMARHRHHRSPASGVVVGGVIVAIGAVLLLDNMGIIRAHDFWRFWPLGLVALGLARMTEGRPATLIWGGFIAVVGVLIFLDTLDIILFNFSLIWPLAIILFGVSMLWKAIDRHKVCDGVEVTDSSQVNLFAVFSGGRRRIDSRDFRGCDVLAIFGGFHIDLKNAVIPDGQKAVVDVNAVFGGVEIDIPENWTVTMSGMGFFGGFEDKTMPPKVVDGQAPPELIITGYAVFGGASVRN